MSHPLLRTSTATVLTAWPCGSVTMGNCFVAVKGTGVASGPVKNYGSYSHTERQPKRILRNHGLSQPCDGTGLRRGPTNKRPTRATSHILRGKRESGEPDVKSCGVRHPMTPAFSFERVSRVREVQRGGGVGHHSLLRRQSPSPELCGSFPNDLLVNNTTVSPVVPPELDLDFTCDSIRRISSPHSTILTSEEVDPQVRPRMRLAQDCRDSGRNFGSLAPATETRPAKTKKAKETKTKTGWWSRCKRNLESIRVISVTPEDIPSIGPRDVWVHTTCAPLGWVRN